jgi:hypothetical protein
MTQNTGNTCGVYQAALFRLLLLLYGPPSGCCCCQICGLLHQSCQCFCTRECISQAQVPQAELQQAARLGLLQRDAATSQLQHAKHGPSPRSGTSS